LTHARAHGAGGRENASAATGLVLVCLVCAGGLWVLRDDRPALAALSNAWLIASALVFVAAAARRARRSVGRQRRGWWLFCAAGAAFAVGQSGWAVLQVRLGTEVPFPSVPEIFFFAELPLAAGGVLCFARGRWGGASRLRTVVDGLLVASALLLISWSTALGAWYEVNATAGTLALVVGVAFPVAHVVVVTLVVIVVARNGVKANVDLALVGLGLVISAAAYGQFGALTATGRYYTGHPVDVAWVLGFGLMTLGALAGPGRADAPQAAPRSAVSGTLAGIAPVLLTGAALLVQSVRLFAGSQPRAIVLWAGAVLVALLLLRQVLSHRENVALAHELERKVSDRTSELVGSEQRWRLLLESSGEGIYGMDPSGTCTFVNEAACTMLGLQAGDLLGRSVHEMIHHSRADGTPYPAADCSMLRILTHGENHRVEGEVLWRPDGSSFPVEFSARPIVQEGNPTGAVVTFNDISTRQAVQQEVEHRALHDALTGLPNRTLVLDRLEQAVLRSARSDSCAGLMIMDLDGFKDINDKHGHPVGDKVLQAVARRLTREGLLRAQDTVSRLGGDEFAMVLPDLACAEDALEVAERVSSAVNEPIHVGAEIFQVSSSIGIAACPDDGTDPTTLVQRADVAMYVAKAKAEGGGWSRYTAAEDAARLARKRLVEELRSSIAGGGLRLHYQPVVDLRGGEIVHVEALCRWQSPSAGTVPPDVFIPLAESSNLILPLTLEVLRQALEQSRRWCREGLAVPVAVNVSAQTLDDPRLMEALEEWHAGPNPAGPLEIEVTESAVMSDPAAALVVLERLVAQGVRIAIDDFGTGYSSLAQLKRLPVHSVKVDRSFVQDLTEDDRDASIVLSIIQLGHTLGLTVVAEGVETGAAAARLLRLGCDLAQGWHYGRPVPPEEVTELLRVRRGSAVAPARQR